MKIDRAEGAAGLRHGVVRGAGGVELAVDCAGDPEAPGILFVHGFAQSRLSFRRQLCSGLADRYHLVAFDLRGQGASGKPGAPEAYLGSQIWAEDIAAVAEQCGLETFVLVGWSLGGYIAMDYVRHRGLAHVVGINLVGSTGGLVESRIMSVIAASQDDPGLSADLSQVIAGAEAMAELYATSQTPEERRILMATELMMPAYVRRSMIRRELRHFDLVDALDVPLLFSTGTQDFIVPEEDMAKVRRALPQARYSTYEGAGHLPFIDATERFDHELYAFAARAHGLPAASPTI